MKSSLLFFCALLGGMLFGQLTAFADDKPRFAELTVICDDNYPPYIFRDSEGNLKGIIPDQWDLFSKKTGTKINLIGMDWGRALDVMRAGGADVIDTIFLTEERKQYYDFTGAYATIDVPIIFHRDLSAITDVDSLKGFTVGVKAGDACIDVLRQNGIKRELVLYDSYESIVKAAAEGQIKVFVMDKPPALYYLYRYGQEREFVVSEPLYSGAFHRAVRRGRTDLLDYLRNGFAKISADEYRNIDQSWMGSPVDRTLNWKYAGGVLALVAFVLLQMLLWNRMLQRRVAARTVELQQALLDLQNSESEYKSLFENLQDVYYRIGRGGKFLLISPSAENLLGYSRQELLEMTLPQNLLLDPAIYYLMQDMIYREGSVRDFEMVLRHRNGEEITVSNTARVVYTADGVPVGVEGMLRDITARKMVVRALRDQKERLAVMLRSIADGVIAVDADGYVEISNPAAAEILGFNPRVLAGAYLRDVYLFTGSGTDDVDSLMREVLQKGNLVDMSAEPVQVRNKGGQLVDIVQVWSPLKDSTGQVNGLIIVFRDISDRLRIERELVRTQRLESLGIFAGGIAHDFNNILTGITGTVSLMRLDLDRNNPLVEYCGDIEKAAARARELTSQLLTFARGGAPVRAPVDLAPLIVDSVRLALSGSNVKPDYDIAPELWPIMADAGQIGQVLNNIVLNAAQAMTYGGKVFITATNSRCGTVHCHDCPAEPMVRISIRDEGPGILPELLPHIFDPFFTTRAEGTGLGLSTCYSIVRRHEGNISVQSTPGQGSEFVICLPAQPELQLEAKKNDSREPMLHWNGRLLLMDDDDMVREVGAALFRALGFEVDAVQSGQAAIDSFRNGMLEGRGYDLLVMDLTIPGGMGGREALKHIHEIDPTAVAIVSSGYSGDAVVSDLAAHGFAAAIMKPYRIEDVQKAIVDLERHGLLPHVSRVSSL